jgi:hypothetical protein
MRICVGHIRYQVTQMNLQLPMCDVDRTRLPLRGAAVSKESALDIPCNFLQLGIRSQNAAAHCARYSARDTVQSFAAHRGVRRCLTPRTARVQSSGAHALAHAASEDSSTFRAWLRAISSCSVRNMIEADNARFSY